MQNADDGGAHGASGSEAGVAGLVLGEQRGTLRVLQMGHILLREGERGDSMFVIRSGLFEITHNGQFLALVGAGEVIGEMALIDSQPRAATAVAIAPSEVLEVTRADFDVAIADPAFVRYLLKMLTGRLRNTDGLAAAFLGAALGGATPAPIPEAKSTEGHAAATQGSAAHHPISAPHAGGIVQGKTPTAPGGSEISWGSGPGKRPFEKKWGE